MRHTIAQRGAGVLMLAGPLARCWRGWGWGSCHSVLGEAHAQHWLRSAVRGTLAPTDLLHRKSRAPWPGMRDPEHVCNRGKMMLYEASNQRPCVLA